MFFTAASRSTLLRRGLWYDYGNRAKRRVGGVGGRDRETMCGGGGYSETLFIFFFYYYSGVGRETRDAQGHKRWPLIRKKKFFFFF